MPARRWSEVLFALLCALGAGLLWLWVRHRGPLSISDDDFARVVIAQRFAQHPSWDPSGTSWLPFPFYFDGLWLKIHGSSLDHARDAAGARAVLASLCVFGSARQLGVRPLLAVALSWLPFALPTLSILTVATVPEYLTAALALLALTLLTRTQAAWQNTVTGLLALALATLSRYETWPVALAIAALHLFFRPGARRVGLAALLGPLAWMLHGAAHHGSPFFFVTRVSSYKASLGLSLDPWWTLLLAYPRSVFEFEPVLMSLTGLSMFVLWRHFRDDRSWIPVCLTLLFSVAALSLAGLGDGAPTHHPERAVTVVWLAAPILPSLVLSQIRTLPLATIWLTGGAALALALASFVLTPTPPRQYQARTSEIEAGQVLLQEQGRRAEPTIVGTSDYGYFAIMAAAGSPQRFVIAKDNDPRKRSVEQALGAAIRDAAQTHPARWLVMPICLDFLVDELSGRFQVRAETRDFLILGPKKN